MELTKLWNENKKTVTTTAIVVIVGMLLIKFFNYIFFGGILIAIAVAAVIGWTYVSKTYGGPVGVWKAFLEELGIK